MRLLTHNMLQCNVKGCNTNNYPLSIHATEVKKEESEFRREFITHILPKLDWPAFVSGARELGQEVPETLPSNATEDDQFLQNVHSILLDVAVQEGELVCPNCKRSFPVKNGIPNMLLNENEV